MTASSGILFFLAFLAGAGTTHLGLAIILLFGRSGTVTQFVADALGLEAGRRIYGLAGVWFAQMLALTPIAFLVLIGVVEGVSPSLEEAAQTLRTDR